MPPIIRHNRLRTVAVAVACLLLIGIDSTSAQERRAIVSGAEMVFVRYGPGMNFPPFARLNKDAEVTIKAHQGEWVQIETASEQVGFVHGKFLTLLERETVVTPAVESRAATTPPTATDPSATPAGVGAGIGDDIPGVEMAPAGVAPPDAAATQAPALEAPVEPPMRLSMADERAAIAQEMRRLASAVASLERRIAENEPIDAAFASTTSEPEGGGMLGGAVLLSLLSAGVGWFLGSRYSRAQERGRQARIRF